MNISRVCLLVYKNSPKVSSLQRNYPIFTFISKNFQTGQEKSKVDSQVKSISSINNANNQQKNETLIKKALNKIPFINVNKNKMRAAGYMLYESIVDQINYVEFFEELELPDTFYSWFVITELHIWMLSVRAMAEGDDGRFLRNSLVEALWVDVGQRVKKLGAHNPAAARAQVAELAEQLQAALIAYDEGLQSDDTILAGALWRRFYQHADVDPKYLDILVQYVRKRVRYLDNLTTEKLVGKDVLRWSSFLK